MNEIFDEVKEVVQNMRLCVREDFVRALTHLGSSVDHTSKRRDGECKADKNDGSNLTARVATGVALTRRDVFAAITTAFAAGAPHAKNREDKQKQKKCKNGKRTRNKERKIVQCAVYAFDAFDDAVVCRGATPDRLTVKPLCGDSRS